MMTRVVSNRSSPSAGLVNPFDRPPVFRVIAEAWRELREGLLNTYRPELLTCAGQGPNGAKNCRWLLFRCWHRGTQESDLIFGRFAEAHLADFDSAQLGRFKALLDCTDRICSTGSSPALRHRKNSIATSCTCCECSLGTTTGKIDTAKLSLLG
jgi:hypothetical protein